MEREADRIFCFEISEKDENIRLDLFLTSQPIGLSRSRVQGLIKSGHVSINEGLSKASYKLKRHDRVLVSIPPVSAPVMEPEAVEFAVVYEDESLIVLNKPPGLVVHPAPGHTTGTLVHGLLRHCRDLSGIGGILRPGIVHRLDKDTSGLMIVAKNDHAHQFLSEQFKTGAVKKEYLVLAHGVIEGKKGEIDLPIARHPQKRKQMSVALSGGKRALSLWKKLDVFESGFSLLSITIKTGRTHQIRVHLSHIGHPVVGDPVYGHGRSWWKNHPVTKDGGLGQIKRQMLHARLLGFLHPEHHRFLEFEAPVPEDMKELLSTLKSFDLGV